MKNKKIHNVFILTLLFLGASCSHISTHRSPSSLKTSYGTCKMEKSKDGYGYHLYVDDKYYPTNQVYSPYEAEKLLNRFSQTGTCGF